MGELGTTIPLLDLAAEIAPLRQELEEALCRVVRGGQFILGPQVAALEEEVAAYLGVRHAVACHSGTDALVISLRALGIGAGDEVVTTPFTFFATAEAISRVGATPVFVDIDEATFNLDAAKIEAALTPRTKAILPVHLFGQAAPMDEICQLARRRDLRVVEDVAQAFGGRYRGRMLGTLGDVAALSFFPSKNLGAFGDGGLVATCDDRIADCARKLRTHGASRKYQNEMIGYNSRLDEIQASILRVKLPHVDRWNAARRRAARHYNRLLAELPWVRTPAESDEAYHVYHQYTVRIAGPNREEVRRQLSRAGVQTMVYYPVPVHKLPVYAKACSLTLPHAEQAARRVLSLPIGPTLSNEAIGRVVKAIKDFDDVTNQPAAGSLTGC